MTSQKSLPPPTSSTDIPDVRLIETEVVRLDPRGLIKNDIAFIKSKLLPVEWNGKRITLDMDGTPLRIGLMLDEDIYKILNEMERFAQSLD